MSKLELQKRFKKENPNVFFTWATYTDWLEKRLEEAERKNLDLLEMLGIKHDSLEPDKPNPGTETPDQEKPLDNK